MASAFERPSRHPAAIYQEGMAAYETGRFLEAIRLLESIINQRGLPATLAKFYLGQAHMRQGIVEIEAGRYAGAAAHLSKARTINPDTPSLSRYLAVCYAAEQRFDLATLELEREESSGSGDATLAIRLAHAFTGDGQYLKGIDVLQRAIYKEPNRADLHYQLGVIQASVEDYAAATTALRRAAELDPGDANIARNLGLALAATNDPHGAAESLANAQRLAPNDAYTGWLLALAADAARKAGITVSLRPVVSANNVADARSLDVLGETVIREPDFVEAFLSLPPSEVDGEVFSVLAATLARALERHPDYADLHFHCARVHERLGRTDAAIIEATRALEINPKYVQALIGLARLYARTDQRDEAIGRLRAAIECGGDYPDVNCLLGELYRAQGRTEEAVAAYRRALSLNNNYARAKEALAALAA